MTGNILLLMHLTIQIFTVLITIPEEGTHVCTSLIVFNWLSWQVTFLEVPHVLIKIAWNVHACK